MDNFDPTEDMGALEGLVSELASRTDRPQGYPFSEVIIYAVPYKELKRFADYFFNVIRYQERLEAVSHA